MVSEFVYLTHLGLLNSVVESGFLCYVTFSRYTGGDINVIKKILTDYVRFLENFQNKNKIKLENDKMREKNYMND